MKGGPDIKPQDVALIAACIANTNKRPAKEFLGEAVELLILAKEILNAKPKKWTINEAAQELGVHERTVKRRLAKLISGAPKPDAFGFSTISPAQGEALTRGPHDPISSTLLDALQKTA
jgi:hypothetical protein